MTMTYVITGIVLVVYLVLVWLLGDMLQMKSPDIWVLRGGLALMGIGAAAVFIWWRRSKQAAEAGGTAEPVDASNEVDILVRDAEARLAAARVPQGSKIGNFPLIFLVGESGSAKTTVLVNSGLEPELLGGQVYQDNNVVPTRTANIWFSRNTIFAEAGGRLMGDKGLWTRVIRRSRGGKLSAMVGKGEQAPRAALVCFDAENFTRQSPDATAAAARNLHDRLLEISNVLGINFPVYVLFTRMDRLPHFRDFVRNLSIDEAMQAVGATLPLVPGQSSGAYSEQQSARVGSAYDNLVRGLCDARPELLGRENDTTIQPATYEFPREFRKLRATIVQFLVDLCRPSQLTTAPFLRGFYFSGVRPVTLSEAAPAQAAAPEARSSGAPAGATGIFHVGQRAQPVQAAAPASGTRRVPQWLFLSHLFHDVILKDRGALAASGSSTKTSFARRLLMAAACLVCLVLATGFTISWVRNRSLESRALTAARGIASSESTGLDLASLPALQRLDALRQTLLELGTYEREGPPLSLRWGLYTGSDLYPAARRVYFDRFRQLLFGQTQAAMLGSLQRLPSTLKPEDQYSPAYDTLKAYLITSSHHEKSTRAFLAPVLQRHWMAGRTVDPPRSQLAQQQFEFYSDELAVENPYSSANDAPAIERGRRYLSLFAGMERVYQNMLAEAAKTNPAIQFNKKFPGSADTVVNTYEVRGAFTKGGWDFMKDALSHAERYFSGEQWVLGEQSAAGLDLAKLGQQLRDRYTNDFLTQWRAYIKAASVVPYASVPDAATKLTVLSGNQSTLLALFWLASQNTNMEDPKIAAAFQPIHTVVPPSSVDRYIAPPNQPYVAALASLQSSLEALAGQPGPPNEAAAAPVLNNASSAKAASRAVGQVFRPDPDGKMDALVQKLLMDPITSVEALLRALGPAELNAKGKGLCTQMRPMLLKYPFSANGKEQATLEDVNAILRKPDGALWAFYDATLQRALPKQGNQYVANPAGGITLNPAFVTSFNKWTALSDALYANGAQNPQLTYMLKPVPTEGVQDMTVQMDGQSLTMSGGNATAKQFTWPGSGAREAKASVKFGGTELGWLNKQGLWAIFQFFDAAEKWQPAGNAFQGEWVNRTGNDVMKLPSGNPLTVRVEVNTPFLEKGYLSKMGCVADIAK